MNEVRHCYEIFELEPGASPEMVKQAYRDLVQIWHPDRFSHDPRLQQKAQERLKEINEAYEQLQNFQPRLLSENFQARPTSNQSQAARSRISGTRKLVLASAIIVPVVLLIFLEMRLSWLEMLDQQVRAGLRQMGFPVAENVSAQQLRAKGRSLYSAKDYRRALPYFQKAIEKNPHDAKTWYHVGYVNNKLGDYQQATQAFQQAIRLNPEYAQAHRGLGMVFAKQSRFQEAIAALKQAALLNPGDAALSYSLARMYLRVGDRDAAVKQYQILRTLSAEKAAQLYKLMP